MLMVPGKEVRWAVSSCEGEEEFLLWNANCVEFKDPYSKSKAIFFKITVIIDINQAQIFSYRPKIN